MHSAIPVALVGGGLCRSGHWMSRCDVSWVWYSVILTARNEPGVRLSQNGLRTANGAQTGTRHVPNRLVAVEPVRQHHISEVSGTAWSVAGIGSHDYSELAQDQDTPQLQSSRRALYIRTCSGTASVQRDFDPGVEDSTGWTSPWENPRSVCYRDHEGVCRSEHMGG